MAVGERASYHSITVVAVHGRSPVEAVRPRLVDWLVTPVFLIGFAGTLLLFDPADPRGEPVRSAPAGVRRGRLQWSLLYVFRLAGTRIVVERDPAVRDGVPYLIIANHQSLFDIPIFGGLLFRSYPKFISKRELAKWFPSISFHLRHGGHAVIDRADRDGATRAIRELGARARERGITAVIYPEGTRARGGVLGPFKPAGALALLDAAPEIPVVVVAIDESWRLLRFKLMPVPYGTRVRVWIGAPIARRPGEDRQALLEGAHAEIERTLARWREESAPQAVADAAQRAARS
jgi:1-acyl-sn-glycerol-3-phosphate acyltransferase